MVISPAIIAMPVVTSVSHATRLDRILREDGVENRIGNLVGDLVGMAFGDGLRSKKIAALTAHFGRTPAEVGKTGSAGDGPCATATPTKSIKCSRFPASRQGTERQSAALRGNDLDADLAVRGVGGATFSTSMVQSARTAVSAPIAAATGASTVPTTPTVSGNSATRLALVLDDDPPDVAFVNELADLRQDLIGRALDLLAPGSFHVSCAPRCRRCRRGESGRMREAHPGCKSKSGGFSTPAGLDVARPRWFDGATCAGGTGRTRRAGAPPARACRSGWWTDRRDRASSGSSAGRRRARGGGWRTNGAARAG